MIRVKVKDSRTHNGSGIVKIPTLIRVKNLSLQPRRALLASV
jgi:hypothetical protein